MTVKIDGTNTEANPAFTGADTDTGLQCGTNELKLVTGGTARATIDSSGNLGIGTSPTTPLQVHSSTTASTIRITNSTSGATSSDGLIIQESGNDAYIWNKENSFISLGTNNAERARLDSSGRLMIGRTTATHKLSLTGTANDKSAELQLTASSVASGYIGPNANGLNIGTDTAGIVFKTGVTGGGSVGATGTERVRILSSGGITFNGDTAAANALDDYEEGSWTPTYVPTSGSFTSVTYSENDGRYTKIGNRVFFNLRIRTASLNKGTGSGGLKISGLPFPVVNNALSGRNAISISIASEWANGVPSAGHCEVNSDDITLLNRDTSNGGTQGVIVTDMNTGTAKNQVWITGSYPVSI